MSKLSEVLKEYMQDRGLTETALAEAIGLQHSTISNLLNGKYDPRFESLEKLLYYFHCSADYLLGREEIPTEESLHPLLPFHERLRFLLSTHSLTRIEPYKVLERKNRSYFVNLAYNTRV